MRSSIGAILIVTVPDTIIRSECRGEAHGTMPRRSTSKRDAKVAIISMAQHARPNVTGHTDDLRAQLKKRVGDGGEREAAGKAVDALGHLLEERRVLVARLRALLVKRLPLLEILDVSPDRDRNHGDGRLYFHSRMPSRYA